MHAGIHGVFVGLSCANPTYAAQLLEPAQGGIFYDRFIGDHRNSFFTFLNTTNNVWDFPLVSGNGFSKKQFARWYFF